MANLVEIRNVHKSYKLGEALVPALRGLNFNLEKGAFQAILGASGSGKSTLLNLLGMLDRPDDGEILFDGMSLKTLTEGQKSELRNSRISIVFQSFNLISVLNVRENIMLPLILRSDLTETEKNSRVEKALNDVGLTKFANHRADQLSGGQRQRVAIARALVPNPDLILADEPTANLDSKTAQTVIDLLLHLNEVRGITFLFATHDEKLISRVKSLSTIEDGVILAKSR